MPTIDFESAIGEFLALGRKLQAGRPLIAEHVLDALITWYRGVRVEDAPLGEGADMLLLQWGTIQMSIVSEPIDLRSVPDGSVKYADLESQYLDFTRQVFAAGSHEDAEFDDLAVQMSIRLGFDPAVGDEPHSNQWIKTPDDIGHCKDVFVSTPFVQSFLTVPAKSVAIMVGYCG